MKKLLLNILIKLINVDGYQVKRARNKVINMKLKAKFNLYRFISPQAVSLKLHRLDLERNTLLILLRYAYLTHMLIIIHNVETECIYFLFCSLLKKNLPSFNFKVVCLACQIIQQHETKLKVKVLLQLCRDRLNGELL